MTANDFMVGSRQKQGLDRLRYVGNNVGGADTAAADRQKQGHPDV